MAGVGLKDNAKDFAGSGVSLGENTPLHPMKFKLPCLVGSIALAVASAFGQQSSGGGLPPPAQNATSQPEPSPSLTRFNLDFPGGTPAELARAIAKASGKHFNLVVMPRIADLRMPALNLANVTISDLSTVLNAIRTAQLVIASHGSGEITDDTVWYLDFYSPDEVALSQFFNLTPYLDTFTVDDITTALKTAWGLMGEAPPKLTFHKETKLLIAVGTQVQLQLIQNELDALKISIAAKKAVADTPKPNPTEAAKQ